MWKVHGEVLAKAARPQKAYCRREMDCGRFIGNPGGKSQHSLGYDSTLSTIHHASRACIFLTTPTRLSILEEDNTSRSQREGGNTVGHVCPTPPYNLHVSDAAWQSVCRSDLLAGAAATQYFRSVVEADEHWRRLSTPGYQCVFYRTDTGNRSCAMTQEVTWGITP